jgi:hypothetical protein
LVGTFVASLSATPGGQALDEPVEPGSGRCDEPDLEAGLSRVATKLRDLKTRRSRAATKAELAGKLGNVHMWGILAILLSAEQKSPKKIRVVSGDEAMSSTAGRSLPVETYAKYQKD